MSEEKKPAETVEAAKPAETPKTEAPKAEAPKEKKPMDPKKKKNIIIWSCVGGGVVIAAIVAIVLVIVLSKVDYKESYEVATSLSKPMSNFYYDYGDCEDVVDYANNDWTSTTSYSSYVSDCKEAVSTETVELVKKLGGTSGVSRDSDLKTLYDKFYELFSKATSGVDGDLSKKLDTYDSWHKFLYSSDSYALYSADESKVNTTADYGINCGNDTLKTFAEQWKTKATELVKAHNDYRNSTIKYSEYSSKEDAFDDWYEANLPKITEVLPLSFEGDRYEIDDAWENLQAGIAKKYGEKAAEDIVNGNSTYEDLIKELMK